MAAVPIGWLEALSVVARDSGGALVPLAGVSLSAVWAWILPASSLEANDILPIRLGSSMLVRELISGRNLVSSSLILDALDDALLNDAASDSESLGGLITSPSSTAGKDYGRSQVSSILGSSSGYLDSHSRYLLRPRQTDCSEVRLSQVDYSRPPISFPLLLR